MKAPLFIFLLHVLLFKLIIFLEYSAIMLINLFPTFTKGRW